MLGSMSKSFLPFFLPWRCPSCRVRAVPLDRRLVRIQRYVAAVRLRQEATRIEEAPNNSSAQTQYISELFANNNNNHKSLFPAVGETEGDDQTESVSSFLSTQAHKFRDLRSGEIDTVPRTLYGRIRGRRQAGKGLHFIDFGSALDNVQLQWNFQKLLKILPQDQDDFSHLQDGYEKVGRSLRKGTWAVATGYVFRNERTGKLDLLLSRAPDVCAQPLTPVPEKVSSQEYLARNRHAEAILYGNGLDVTIMRFKIIQRLRQFFLDRRFVEVNTPLLAGDAGGAAARAFQTQATEFKDTKLRLRVAPELWLKRLIVGDLHRVFEIGPSFRNEGVDKTHNPEFTVCEFYAAMMSLEQMLSSTEDLLWELSRTAKQHREERAERAHRTVEDIYGTSGNVVEFNEESFARIPFIPTMISQARTRLPGWTFPDLDLPEAHAQLLRLVEAFDIPVSSEAGQTAQNITLPKLLDHLASHLLEPLCKDRPAWITGHPAIMSPLAKSRYEQIDVALTNGTGPEIISYHVSMRAELFISGREYVNCYEEENSPIEQRHKFERQLEFRRQEQKTRSQAQNNTNNINVNNTDKDNHKESTKYKDKQKDNDDDDDELEGSATIDESYIAALEWGMPPTGGWGCGVDRLVMLFTGRERIADVLPFGNLHNVVGLASQGKGSSASASSSTSASAALARTVGISPAVLR